MSKVRQPSNREIVIPYAIEAFKDIFRTDLSLERLAASAVTLIPAVPITAVAAIEASCAPSRVVPRNHITGTRDMEIRGSPVELELNNIYDGQFLLQQIVGKVLGDLPHLPFSFVYREDSEVLRQGISRGIEPENPETDAYTPVPELKLVNGKLVQKRTLTYSLDDLEINGYTVKGTGADLSAFENREPGTFYVTEVDLRELRLIKEIMGGKYFFTHVPERESNQKGKLNIYIMPYDEDRTIMRTNLRTGQISFTNEEGMEGVYRPRNLTSIRTDPNLREYAIRFKEQERQLPKKTMGNQADAS